MIDNCLKIFMGNFGLSEYNFDSPLRIYAN